MLDLSRIRFALLLINLVAPPTFFYSFLLLPFQLSTFGSIQPRSREFAISP